MTLRIEKTRVMKPSELKKIEPVEKARKYPIGTVRKWTVGSYKKEGERKWKPVPEKGTPDWHKLKIAKDTMKMNPVMAAVAGGPSVDEAKATLAEYGLVEAPEVNYDGSPGAVSLGYPGKYKAFLYVIHESQQEGKPYYVYGGVDSGLAVMQKLEGAGLVQLFEEYDSLNHVLKHYVTLTDKGREVIGLPEREPYPMVESPEAPYGMLSNKGKVSGIKIVTKIKRAFESYHLHDPKSQFTFNRRPNGSVDIELKTADALMAWNQMNLGSELHNEQTAVTRLTPSNQLPAVFNVGVRAVPPAKGAQAYDDTSKKSMSEHKLTFGKSVLESLRAKKWKQALAAVMKKSEPARKPMREIIETLQKAEESLSKEDDMLFLNKGRAYPIGTIRQWKGADYKKLEQRKWRPVPKSGYDKDLYATMGTTPHGMFTAEVKRKISTNPDRFEVESGTQDFTPNAVKTFLHEHKVPYENITMVADPAQTYARQSYVQHLNEVGESLSEDEFIIGGKFRKRYYPNRYGEALRAHDPIAYRLGEHEWEDELREPDAPYGEGYHGEAEEILRQLGGHRFIAMTGAKTFVKWNTPEGLPQMSFRIPRAKDGINSVVIRLNGLDLYDIDFGRIHGGDYKIKKQFKGIYNDQLAEIFEQTTGLYTSLGTMGR